ncbi:pyridoxal-dependent decarboxylase [Mangrovactinospora gilvigrisea]|uniref:Pyridoxal-dependent decarboxylase n=1 Tax=Mangrovactinospora gilvigrisea TaxID=1428644 RepID=A0A1J7B9D4_9ACTN|nr:aspartate aminotransferase family protein [Mangrovactinospora gilvigrisea]OIV35230.1 pyridoxal-dependent decarboxylase [Mangrovactinospora gilvigrisea]
MNPRDHLLNNGTADAYREAVTGTVERLAKALGAVERPFTGATPGDLAPATDAVDLDTPAASADAALDELADLYLRDAVWFHHPRYLAHLNCPVVIPAVAGESVLAAVNSSLDTWDQSAGGTLIERRLVDWTAQRLGLGESADGVFTSGGTQSNLQALLLAREEACERIAAASRIPLRRPEILPRLRILASDCSHFSVVKAARVLGLGDDAVVTVPTGADRRMRTVALARELDRLAARGLVPMAVVATAGTTDFGSIDPLPQIAELAARHGAWLHVDAAYGCGLLVSRRPERRALLAGIERADSVTVDYHKSFFQTVSSSAVLVRDARTLRHAGYHADYLNPAGGGNPNQVDKSLQTTRRFDALKLWLTLRTMGPDGIGALFDDVLDLAVEAHALVDADPRFAVAAEPALSTLVFRWTGGPPELLDAANRHARAALAASGAGLVAGTVADGAAQLKFTLLNPETTAKDIAAVLDLLAGHAARYAARHAAEHAADLEVQARAS